MRHSKMASSYDNICRSNRVVSPRTAANQHELRRLTEDNVEAKRYRYDRKKNVPFLQQQVAMLDSLVQGKRAVPCSTGCPAIAQ
jgi:hypothetical protein